MTTLKPMRSKDYSTQNPKPRIDITGSDPKITRMHRGNFSHLGEVKGGKTSELPQFWSRFLSYERVMRGGTDFILNQEYTFRKDSWPTLLTLGSVI
jgi:hypothetical protein